MALGESGGMIPRKIFENLDTVMTILVLFEPKFFAPNSECFNQI